MKRDKKSKVAVAMSGGVDSGAAAELLVRAGYQAAGFHMKLWQEDVPRSDLVKNKCCDLESLEAARKTAHQLEMPLYVVNLEKVFKKRVVGYFLQAYAVGLTPNPCVMCNRFIKFGELLDYVRRLGYDYLATGHYARVIRDKQYEIGDRKYATNNRKKNLSLISYRLLRARDERKDQSYFLYSLTQKQLSHVMFPVGEYLKDEVRKMAKRWKLPAAERPESQEICFFTESDYRPFLRRQITEKIVPGEVVNVEGRVIGKHKGLPLYTIGQRHGFEVGGEGVKWEASRPARFESRPPARTSSRRSRAGSESGGEVGMRSGVIPPFYVIGKDVKHNQLIVGFGRETERKEFWAKEVNWINKSAIKQLSYRAIKCWVRIRHGGELLRARIQRNIGDRRDRGDIGGKSAAKTPRRWRDNDLDSCEVERRLKRVEVILDDPERGIAPGQAAVFYRKIKYQKLNIKNTNKISKGERSKDKRSANCEVLGGGIIASR